MNLISKWKNMPDAAKSAMAFTISSFLIRGINFITTPIFTRILSTEDYGLVSTYNSWVSILEVFCLLGLTSAGVFNVGLNDYKDNRDRFISSMLTLCNIVTIAIFSVIVVCKIIVGSEFLLPNTLLILMFLHFITNPAQIFWITRQRYEYQYKVATLVTIASTVISQVGAIVCIKYADSINAGIVRLWSTEIASLMFVLPIYIMLLARGKSFVNLSIWKNVLCFAIPLLPHYLAQHIMLSADRIMLTEMVSQSDAGIYAVVSAIGMISSIVWNAINASLIPFTFEKMNVKKYCDINRITLILVSGYAAMCIGVALIAPEVLFILAPEEYYGGVHAIPAIAGTAFLAALYNVYANIEFYHKKTGSVAIATVLAAIVNVVLNIWLIPKFSYVGAAYTTLISYIVLIVVHYVGYCQCQKERIYNSKLILLISLGCLVLCEICHLFYEFGCIRYGLIVIVFVIGLLNVKKIKHIVSFIKKN